MATSTRPFLMTGAALLSAAAIATAAPSGLPGQVAGLPSPLKLSTAQYNLTALSDITFSGVTEALTVGWGGFIGPTDPFYPDEFNNDALLTGPAGVAYYVLDNALNGIDTFNVENYFFEVGSKSGDLIQGGLAAAAYVAAGSAFGIDSAPAQLVKALVSGGSTDGLDVGAAIMSLTSGIPVVGDLTSIYFTGQASGDATEYGTGFAGVLAYASKLLPGLGDLSNLNLKGLIAGINGVIGGIGGVIGGRGWSHSHSGGDHDSEGADDTDTDTESESEHHGHGKSAPAVAARAVASVSAAKPATAVAKSAAAVTTNAQDATEATESERTGTSAAVGSDSAADTGQSAAPKRSAQRVGASTAGAKRAAGHLGKRGKASRAAN